jgi:cyclopropane fatty-acyl-phospholipid synthase-like methyltransferase
VAECSFDRGTLSYDYAHSIAFEEHTMSALQEQYALGRSPHEYARLGRQAEILKPMTRRFFAEAGIEPGMRVLDLGSGAGDICMLLAEMVGSGGSAIGLDIDQDALLHSQERVDAAGLSNITFGRGSRSISENFV